MTTETKNESDSTWTTSVDPFRQLLDDFTARTTEVKNLFLSRITGSVKEIYQSEINTLAKEVELLEVKMSSLEDFLQNEKAEIEKAKALQKACLLQKSHLDYIQHHLPSQLPSLTLNTTNENQPKQDSTMTGEEEPENGKTVKIKKKLGSRLQYVSQEELDSVSSYMKGRLTIDRINRAVDEITVRVEGNFKLLAAAKTKGSTITSEERRHAMEVLHKIGKLNSVAGRSFFLETDLKGGTYATMDKTGKSILTILRHLGKIHEVSFSPWKCSLARLLWSVGKGVY